MVSPNNNNKKKQCSIAIPAGQVELSTQGRLYIFIALLGTVTSYSPAELSSEIGKKEVLADSTQPGGAAAAINEVARELLHSAYSPGREKTATVGTSSTTGRVLVCGCHTRAPKPNSVSLCVSGAEARIINSLYRARKIFSVPVAEFFGPSPGAIFLVALAFILVAIVRQDSKV